MDKLNDSVNELKKMVLAMANSVSSLSQSMNELRSDMNDGFKKTNELINIVEKNLTKRIDMIGISEAQLEDLPAMLTA